MEARNVKSWKNLKIKFTFKYKIIRESKGGDSASADYFVEDLKVLMDVKEYDLDFVCNPGETHRLPVLLTVK